MVWIRCRSMILLGSSDRSSNNGYYVFVRGICVMADYICQ
jgi:hypothetical protein